MALRVVPIVSSLELQKLLYANIFTGAWFGAVEIGLTIFKLTQLDVSLSPFTRLGLPVLVTMWCTVELFRVRLGYSGNLGEKVPEASAFWLLTLLPQVPAVLFLTFAQPMGLPLDTAAGILQVIVTLAQLHYGFHVVRTFIRKQTLDFYRLCVEEGLAASSAGRGRTLRQPEAAWGAPGEGGPTPSSASTGGASYTFMSAPASDAAYAEATSAAGAGVPMPEPSVSMGGVASEGARHLAGGTPASPVTDWEARGNGGGRSRRGSAASAARVARRPAEAESKAE